MSSNTTGYKINETDLSFKIMKYFFLFFNCVLSDRINVEVRDDASFTIRGDNSFELVSGDYFQVLLGRKFSVADNTLQISKPIKSDGTNQHGLYREYTFKTFVSGSTTEIDMSSKSLSIRVYEGFVVFRQSFEYEYNWDNKDQLSILATGFPSIKIPSNSSNAYFLNPCGDMAGSGAHKGDWSATGMKDYCAGEEGGILFIYDQSNQTYNGQVFSISAFRHFTAVYSDVVDQELVFGLPLSVVSTPAGYYIETFISYSNKGFYEGVQKWGSELLSEHGKNTMKRATDITVNYLGYWTDRGAYYYYYTEPNKTYEETMIDIYENIENPYRSWNYDSWFYHKCEWPGQKSHEWPAKNWTAIESIFPNGMNKVYQETSIPVIAHNRFYQLFLQF